MGSYVIVEDIAKEKSMHLIDIPNQERETVAILRLLHTDSLVQPLFHALGLTWPMCWCLIQMSQEKLVPRRRGDVDILAGNLAWNDPEQFSSYVRAEAVARSNWNPSWHFDFAARKLGAEGGIMWPPSTDYLVAFEVKRAYSSDRLHAAKSNKGINIRKQVCELQKMGFDHVVLLDVIANKPVSGSGLDTWFAATSKALDSFQEMLGILRCRLETRTPVHHLAFSIGAVVGGDESLRGAGKPIPIHQGTTSYNSNNATMAANRSEMNRNIRRLFGGYPASNFYPYVLIDCGPGLPRVQCIT